VRHRPPAPPNPRSWPSKAEVSVETAIERLPPVVDEGGGGAVSFILGDDQGFTEEAQTLLAEMGGVQPVGLGAEMLLTSHAIIFVHCLLRHCH